MTEQILVKDESIHKVLAKLRKALRRRAYQVVDHWEGSLCAVGVASPEDQRVLAYISTFDKPEGYYFLSLELPPPPGSERAYVPAGEHEHVDFRELARLVREHLDPGSWKAKRDGEWRMEAGTAVSKSRGIKGG